MKKKSKKKIYYLQKVIDPHSSMPENVKDALFEVGRKYELHNDSFINWFINDIEDYDEDDLNCKNHKIIDDWLLDNGIKKDEDIMILYWW